MADNPKKDGNGPATPESAPAMETVPASELEILRAAGAKAAEYLDLAKRTQADFINYQARVRREREDLVRFGTDGLLRELLPLADDLERVLAAAEKGENPGVLEGIRLVQRELLRIFAKTGVRPIETVGRKFDPEFHEASETVEAPPGVAEGSIVQEVRRGYTIHDRVLRPASVKVSKAAKS
ncbi:MAG TPA: nucleotide exchange factor GrpE [Planctomycetota bacterium]|nr:nucleotide exchange factor GrpE [Planctomycetota bacterium]